MRVVYPIFSNLRCEKRFLLLLVDVFMPWGRFQRPA